MAQATGKPVVFLSFANGVEHNYLQQLKKESTVLRDLFLPLHQNGDIELVREESLEDSDLPKLMARYKDRIAIFHFAGHASGKALNLEGGYGHAKGLAQLLSLQKELKIAFLNGCSTQGQTKPYLEAGIPVVLATTKEISDTEATFFAQQFYHALVHQHSIREAFQVATGALRTRVFTHERRREEIVCYRGLLSRNENLEELPWRLYYLHEKEEAILDWSLPKQPTLDVEILIEGELQDFNDTRKEDLIAMVAAVLKIDKDSVKIKKVMEGSIKVIMELPKEKAEEWIKFFIANDKELSGLLKEQNIKNIQSANLFKSELELTKIKQKTPSEIELEMPSNLVEKIFKYNKKKSRLYLVGANLVGAVLNFANLVGADLSRADLSGASLIGVDLGGANLSEANLVGAGLGGADLIEANLSGADLSRADLIEANLSGANLSGANLSGASLIKANLSGALLSGVKLRGAVFHISQENLLKGMGIDTGVINFIDDENLLISDNIEIDI